MSEPLPDGGIELSAEEVEARWSSYWTPVAGWALELRFGVCTSVHGGIEIAVPAAGFPEVRDRFPEYAFDAVGGGRIWPDPAPQALAATRQTWLRDPGTGRYLLDVFREPHDGDTWICRHNTAIRLPYTEVVRRTADGVPYLAPELVLLFKAKHARPKDEADFAEALARMSAHERTTLAELIARTHPGHRWLASL